MNIQLVDNDKNVIVIIYHGRKLTWEYYTTIYVD